MTQLYTFLVPILRAMYGIFAAIFLYNANQTEPTSIPQIVAQILENPCGIQQGLLGLVLSPSLLPVVGLFVMAIGGFYVMRDAVGAFGGIFGILFSRLMGIVDQVTSIFTRTRGRGYGYERGYGGRHGYGYGDDVETAREGFSFSRFSSGVILIIIGGLIAAGGSNAGGIRDAIVVFGNIISGMFMLVISVVVYLLTSLFAAALGAQQQPICTGIASLPSLFIWG